MQDPEPDPGLVYVNLRRDFPTREPAPPGRGRGLKRRAQATAPTAEQIGRQQCWCFVRQESCKGDQPPTVDSQVSKQNAGGTRQSRAIVTRAHAPRQYRVGCFGTDVAGAKGPSVLHGAQDRASPNFMGLTSFGLEIGI